MDLEIQKITKQLILILFQGTCHSYASTMECEVRHIQEIVVHIIRRHGDSFLIVQLKLD